MPTIATMRIPPPRSWDEFQSITTSALRIRWSSPTLVQHGRQGQAQQGVDVFGPDHLGRDTGIQCKCQDSIDRKTIDADIALAETFQPKLANYYFAIAGARDAAIQQQFRLISEERLRNNKFAVGIFFWDDLLEDLTRSPEEFHKHFPDLRLDGEPAVDVNAQLFAAYDVAYHGIDIRLSIDLIFGEIGVMADENPLQLDHMMRIIEASAERLMSQARHQDLVALSRRLVDTAMAARERKAEWDTVDGIAGSIESVVRGLEYTLSGAPLTALDLGFAMRQWEQVSLTPDAPVSIELKGRLLGRCRVLDLPNDLMTWLNDAIDQFNKELDLASGNVPRRAYNRVRRAIRNKRLASAQV